MTVLVIILLWLLGGFIGACICYGTMKNIFGSVDRMDARFATGFGVFGGPLWILAVLFAIWIHGDKFGFKIPFTGIEE